LLLTKQQKLPALRGTENRSCAAKIPLTLSSVYCLHSADQPQTVFDTDAFHSELRALPCTASSDNRAFILARRRYP